MNIDRFTIAKKDIFSLFDKLENKVMDKKSISKIFYENKDFWRLSINTTVNNFINLLIDNEKLSKIEFNFPFRKETKYVWGEIPLYTLLSTIKLNSYFSHYTAMYFHGLTEQLPKTIYINQEQRERLQLNDILLQERIDIAFSRKPRITTNTTEYGDYKICLINGKQTGNLGVIDFVTSSGEQIKVTNIERTLIDIVVRPIYSGGIFEVLKAYKQAQTKVSINKLVAFLKKLNYKYPYHQAIGFYLERSGVYSESQMNLLKNIDMKYNFYLTYNTKEKEFSEKWKLYYPKGF